MFLSRMLNTCYMRQRGNTDRDIVPSTELVLSIEKLVFNFFFFVVVATKRLSNFNTLDFRLHTFDWENSKQIR